MYLFLFQAPKHRQTYSWQYYRHKKSNTRNEFDLRHLRRAAKGNATIWGAGTHPIQKLLYNAGITEILNGHLIETDDPKVAMWIKLNYDIIGKNGTQYVCGYKDLDIDRVVELKSAIDISSTTRKNSSQISSDITGLHYAIERLMTRISKSGPDPELNDAALAQCSDLMVTLGSVIDVKLQSDRKLSNQIAENRDALIAYVKSCGIDPGAR